jgi:hypothetical protein
VSMRFVPLSTQQYSHSVLWQHDGLRSRKFCHSKKSLCSAAAAEIAMTQSIAVTSESLPDLREKPNDELQKDFA